MFQHTYTLPMFRESVVMDVVFVLASFNSLVCLVVFENFKIIILPHSFVDDDWRE